MQTIPEPSVGAPAMAKGGSGSAAPAGGAATFRLVEGATMTLPDGCTATVRQGSLELSDGQRLPLPEAGGTVTIERRVVRPDGRAALMRHTIRVGEPAETRPAEVPAPADKVPAEVSVAKAAEVREDAPQKTLTEVPLEADDKKTVEVPAEVPDKVLEKVPTEARNEEPAKVSAEVQGEAPAKIQSEVSKETPVVAPVEKTAEEPADTPAEVPPEIQMEQSDNIPATVPTKVTSEVNTEKPVETIAEMTDNQPTEESADVPADDDVNSSDVATGEEKSTIFSASLCTPLLSATPEDVSSSAPEDAPRLTSAPKGECSGDDFQPSHTPSPAKQSSTSAPESYSSRSPSSAVKGSLSPVSEDDEPSFENASVKFLAGGEPYCEWTETGSTEIPDKSNAPAAAEAVQDAPRKGDVESKSPVKEENEADEEPEPVVASRLTHHDSLRLPIHVPRIRKRSDGDSNPTDTHSPCGRKAAAHLNDPHKKHQEDEAMRTTLNSILHKLGYSVPVPTGNDAEDHTSKDPGGIIVVRPQQSETPNQVVAEGPEEPEPVSVPKVISYFESITPQRVESPVERRKWRNSDRSPSALRSPRSARSPEPSREPGQSPNRQPSSPRRVNFADSAQRVFISGTSEPDEMENIPIPRPEDSSFSSPESVQCVKEIEPVVTTQPTRLTTILVQNSPDKAPQDSKPADGTPGASAEAQDTLDKNGSSETSQASSLQLSSSVLETEDAPPSAPANSASLATTDRTEPPGAEQGKPEVATQIQSSTNERTPEPEDVPDSSETAPLITSSTAEELNQVSPTKDSANGAAAPIQAEPLARPSSVILQGDLPLSDFPTSRAVDPTELPDGAGPVLTADGAPEEAVGTGPNDPFLPDESVQQHSATAKPSTWFEDCVAVCCCCWIP